MYRKQLDAEVSMRILKSGSNDVREDATKYRQHKVYFVKVCLRRGTPRWYELASRISRCEA